METQPMPKDQRNSELDDIYYKAGDPGSYGGIRRLFTRAREIGLRNISQNKIRKYLSNQHAYSLHKPARRRFRRNKTVVGKIDQQWQADLADMQGIASANDGFKYLLTVIDIFSKYAWVIPLKDKSGGKVLVGFQKLLEISHPRKPLKLQTDAGKEFLNIQLQTFLKRLRIHHFVAPSDTKASVVERFNRTLKTRIWTYFTAHQTHRYIDVLNDIVDAYNHSKHRTIGMRPCDVKKKDEVTLFRRMFPKTKRVIRDEKPIPRGTMVRVSKVKGNFDKGYVPNWSEEHFLVESSKQSPRTVYKLKDKLGEEVTGAWYPEELQPIQKNKYLIDEVLKRRKGPRGKPEIFVHWKGWPSKFNSWIPANDVEYVH